MVHPTGAFCDSIEVLSVFWDLAVAVVLEIEWLIDQTARSRFWWICCWKVCRVQIGGPSGRCWNGEFFACQTNVGFALRECVVEARLWYVWTGSRCKSGILACRSCSGGVVHTVSGHVLGRCWLLLVSVVLNVVWWLCVAWWKDSWVVGTKAGSCSFAAFVFVVVKMLLLVGVVQTDSSCLGYKTNAMQVHDTGWQFCNCLSFRCLLFYR